MFVKKYIPFLETRLFDLVNLKSHESEIEKIIKRYQEMDFDFSSKLVKWITLNKRIGGKKARMQVKWNDDAEHDLKKRIENRTTFKSVDEFNQYFKEVVNKIFPDEILDTIYISGRYSIYDKEKNITMSIAFDIDQYLDEIYEISVITILTGRKSNKKTVKILDI